MTAMIVMLATEIHGTNTQKKHTKMHVSGG